MITKDEVREIAGLARLGLDPAEAELFHRQLGALLEHMRQIDGLDVEGIEPTSHLAPVGCPMREDEVCVGMDRDLFLAAAPDRADGHIQTLSPIRGSR